MSVAWYQRRSASSNYPDRYRSHLPSWLKTSFIIFAGWAIEEILPKNAKISFDLINRLLTKKEVGDVIDQVYRHTGQKDTVLFADAIMALGFRHAFKAGISFGKDDMIIPDSKDALVAETKDLVADYEQQYQDGLITQQEKYNKVIDAWSRCGDQVATAMMKEISATPKLDNGRQADQTEKTRIHRH